MTKAFILLLALSRSVPIAGTDFKPTWAPVAIYATKETCEKARWQLRTAIGGMQTACKPYNFYQE